MISVCPVRSILWTSPFRHSSNQPRMINSRSSSVVGRKNVAPFQSMCPEIPSYILLSALFAMTNSSSWCTHYPHDNQNFAFEFENEFKTQHSDYRGFFANT